MKGNYGLLGLDVLTLKKRGITWTLKHHDRKLELKISQEPGESEKNEWQEISGEFCGYFSFSIDPRNIIHFIYKNNDEQVVYLGQSFQGKEKIFKMSFPEGEQITYQRITSIGEKKILLLVFTENFAENRWKIYSCTLKDGTWMESEIVDSGWGVSLGQGAIAIGNEEQVYLVYQIFNQGQYQLVYRINKNDHWSDRALISFSQQFNSNPSLAIDKEGTPHLVWLRSIKSHTRVLYTSKSRVNSFWTRWLWNKEELISLLGTNCVAPIIIFRDKGPEIYWQVVVDKYSSVFCLAKGNKEQVKLINNFKSQGLYNMLLDLDKLPDLDNYSEISAGSTLLLLLAVFEENITQLEQNGQCISDELLKERAKVEKLELINAKLQNTLLKKSKDYFKAQNKWEIKEKELEKEIERLKQGQNVIQKINEELRQRLTDEELLRKVENKEKNADETDVRKVYPHFPFMIKRF